MNYKISVIVPVYNVENYLAQCLKSIIGQTLKDIEIICINDGSKDASLKVLEDFQQNDSRIFIISKKNEGYGAACNAGLRFARGEYISIIEPDDFIDENMYEDLYSLAKANDVDIVKSAFYEYTDGSDNNKETVEKINWSDDYNMPNTVFKVADCSQLLYFHPSIWSCIYRSEFLNKNNIRFVEAKGAGWVDNPFQIETLCLADRILYTDKPYYYYRLTNPSSSSNIVNIDNPFDRSDEVHSFLEKNNIENSDILAHLYKRELGYIHTVLGGISSDLFESACNKIQPMIQRMHKDVLYKNEFVKDYEKIFYENCKSKDGIWGLMKQLQAENENVQVIKANA